MHSMQVKRSNRARIGAAGHGNDDDLLRLYGPTSLCPRSAWRHTRARSTLATRGKMKDLYAGAAFAQHRANAAC